MSFRTRNVYYLRVSKKSVLPLYVYLDTRHLDWMTDAILQHVLEDLRPNILPKLREEADVGAGGKKATVDTHRGDIYQFCYFFRKVEPHSVLLKSRTFVAVPTSAHTQSTTAPPTSSVNSRKGKRKGKGRQDQDTGLSASRKKRKLKGKEKAVDPPGSTLVDDEGSTVEALPSRRSERVRKQFAGGYRDESEGEQQEADANMNEPAVDEAEDLYVPEEGPSEEDSGIMQVDLTIEDEEEKPKPMLKLKYTGFEIYGRALCVVVEPWPPFQYSVVAPTSATGQDFGEKTSSSNSQLRAKTPLFLPDSDSQPEMRPSASQQLHVIFQDHRFGFGEGNSCGMMEYSTVLNATGEYRAGAALDEDEDMGEIYFGDADEVRELK